MTDEDQNATMTLELRCEEGLASGDIAVIDLIRMIVLEPKPQPMLLKSEVPAKGTVTYTGAKKHMDRLRGAWEFLTRQEGPWDKHELGRFFRLDQYPDEEEHADLFRKRFEENLAWAEEQAVARRLNGADWQQRAARLAKTLTLV